MMSPTHFSPPAYLTDLTEENAKRWSSEYVSKWDDRATSRPNVTQSYNEMTRRENVTWMAFPNRVRVVTSGNQARWRVADSSRDQQDEYYEWSVTRNDEGKIVKVVFTCEGPEYWRALSELQPNTLLELYRQHNPGYDIKEEDLSPGSGYDDNGRYIPNNKWNNTTTGSIMHLIRVSNTLQAQVNLGADATVLRKDSNGDPIDDTNRLTLCGRLGDPNRNSDPHIGSKINNLAKMGPLITIADPIGLYIHSFNGNNS
ncbi:hypothetical protein BDD12DRAFT_925380 [Trichophaea hybrida]|nr:hypothetical protein BDD12DRAFT_925380 [Trichophaea hybrida]